MDLTVLTFILVMLLADFLVSRVINFLDRLLHHLLLPLHHVQLSTLLLQYLRSTTPSPISSPHHPPNPPPSPPPPPPMPPRQEEKTTAQPPPLHATPEASQIADQHGQGEILLALPPPLASPETGLPPSSPLAAASEASNAEPQLLLTPPPPPPLLASPQVTAHIAEIDGLEVVLTPPPPPPFELHVSSHMAEINGHQVLLTPPPPPPLFAAAARILPTPPVRSFLSPKTPEDPDKKTFKPELPPILEDWMLVAEDERWVYEEVEEEVQVQVEDGRCIHQEEEEEVQVQVEDGRWIHQEVEDQEVQVQGRRRRGGLRRKIASSFRRFSTSICSCY